MLSEGFENHIIHLALEIKHIVFRENLQIIVELEVNLIIKRK